MIKDKKSKKFLLIVESPNKIKKLNAILGDTAVIRATVGHFMELKSTKTNNLGIDIKKDFKPLYTVVADKKDKLQAIIDATKGVSEIYICSDPDREGEAIAHHLLGCLDSVSVPIKRATFNEITKKAILNAIQNPVPFDENLNKAAVARRVLDRITGFSCSPYVSDTLGSKGLSSGRVQSPALRLVVDRDREIENFKPDEYWNINATLAKPKSLKEKFIAKYNKKITNQKDALKIKDDLDKDTFKITDVVAKEKLRNAPPALTTSAVQQVASARFGLSATKTMDICQTLFEQGKISYHRTDSIILSDDAISDIRTWLSSNNHKLPKSPNIFKNKESVQAGHEAIRPTSVDLTPDKFFGGDQEQKLYRLIWERAVCSQMLPAVYDTVSITVLSSSKHELKANGRTLKDPGWLAIAADQVSEKKADDEDDVQLPILKIGDDVVLVDPRVETEQKFTQPPPRYSEGSLVKELEKRGIGRPSTFATIIGNIRNRGYVELKGKVLHSTNVGRNVVDALKKYFKFMEYDYTADMETQLDLIAAGKLGYVEMLDNFYKPFQKELKSAYADRTNDSGISCPKCNDTMIIKHGKFGYYLACVKYPADCRGTLSCDLVDGKPVIKTREQKIIPGVDCPICKAPMMERDGKFGAFYGCTKSNCKGSRKKPYGKKCSDCGKELYATIYQEESVLFCMGYPNCYHKEKLDKDLKVPEKYKTKPYPKNIKKMIKNKR